jgi:ArsR family transcriptional regulator
MASDDVSAAAAAGPPLIRSPLPLARPRVVVEHRNLTVDVFRALADPVRLEILALIAARGPLCSCHLQDELNYNQPRISKHLGVLRKAGLVSSERRGSWVYYSVAPDALEVATDFIGQVERSLHTPREADYCPPPD